MRPNSRLERLIDDLKHEFQSMLDQEEIFWYKKARSDWVRFGDRNTRYYHLSTMIRRRRNKMEALLNDEGVLISNPEELKELVVRALIMKLGWDLIDNHSALWVRFLRAKYKAGSDVIPTMRRFSNESMVWRSICNSWEFVLKGTCWRLGDGASILFWTDYWLKSGLILNDVISNPLPVDRLYDSVKDVSLEDGSWDMARFSPWLLGTALAEVSAHLVGVPVLGPDKPIWKFTHDETEKHLLLECSVVSNFWELFGERPVHALDASLSVVDWMFKNLKIHGVLFNGIPWSLLFGIACWAIWRARNAHIFRNHDSDQQRVFHFCVVSAKEFLNVHAAHAPVVRAFLHKEDKWIQWIPPDWGWIKWNLDGSVFQHSGDAASGAILRDSNGNWLGGVVRHIGTTSIIMAELWAFKDAISLSIHRGDDFIYFESESTAAVNFIKMGVHQNHPCYAMVSSIRHDLRRFQHFHIIHTYREGNFAADFLVRIGHSYQIGSHVVSEPPPSLSNILFGDSFGVCFVRRVVA
ncbi:Ribonuclease H-like superfamily [Sesbania bispinosa]|nr:Ribonuclease H-like superfamily [Sesbania bispinosa]